MRIGLREVAECYQAAAPHAGRIAALLSLFIISDMSWGAHPSFRVHRVNPDSTFCAAAGIDVNRDGRLDIVCGGFWYEAPTWKKQVVREVEQINGRYDDYSHLPLDVNGDGRTDLVSANWRSRSLYWIEQPAGVGDAWKQHAIETPGHMETARLHDIDGDGRLDILPNCVRTADGKPFAAWWELVRGRERGERGPAVFVRHDLPDEVASHGIGFGDVNGDGRGDIVSARGWLEAPEDRRAGRWVWHPDFSLDADASIPILVWDVDGDGDTDLVWGRGHQIGLYWLEQIRDADSPTRWVRHVIDTSWSQAHSLLLADLDNDGTPELIAGKRFLGHDGRDPGEYDPLEIHWYRFDPQQRTWHRGLVSDNPSAGFGLDPKAVDLDGDGDLDLLGPGRSGLYWYENLLDGPGAKTPAAGQATSVTARDPKYTDHSRLLVYSQADSLLPVKTPLDWGRRRADVLLGMSKAMGPSPTPDRRVPLDVRETKVEETEKYTRHTISFASEPGDRVPAYLLVPKGLTRAAPAMLCLHQTTAIGKGEPAGLGGLPTLRYGHELAERGFVCLVPDYPSFGDYAYDFKTSGSHFGSGSMKAIWNNMRAVDLLASLPEVDRDRIGCIGHSLGGHNSLFTAAWDQRLRAIVTSCGFTAFHHYYEGKLAGWTSDRYMPRIRDNYQNDPDRVPFDFHEVIGALAPRHVLINAPLHDSNFEVTGVKKVVEACAPLYELLGASGHLEAVYPDCGHDFPDEIRSRFYARLQEILK